LILLVSAAAGYPCAVIACPSTEAKFGVFAGIVCSAILIWATAPFGAA